MFDPVAVLAPTELVLAIADSGRQESMLVAQRMADIAELLAQRTVEVQAEDPDPGFMLVTGFQRTCAEVAAAMNLSPAAASVMVSHADTLMERLPQVAAVLAAGDTDWPTVAVIITRTEFLRTARWPGWTPTWPDGCRGGTAGRVGGSSTPSTPLCVGVIPTPSASGSAKKTGAALR